MSDWWNADPVAQPQGNANWWQSDPAAGQQQPRGAMDQLFGISGPRFQLWPERAARQLMGDVQGLATSNNAIPTSGNYTDADEALRQANEAATPGAAYDVASAISPAARGGVPIVGRSAAPTEAELAAAKNALYNSPAVTGLRLNPNVGSTLTNQVNAALLQNKLDSQNAPDVLKAVSGLAKGGRFESPTQVSQTELAGPGFHIANETTVPAPLQVSDIDLARQSLSDVPQEQRRAAGIARGVIDNYLGGGIQQSDVMGGNLGQATQALLDARGNTAALKRSQEITSALTRADNQTGSTYSGTNLDNATRQALRPILNNKMGVSLKKNVFQDYTPQEVDAVRTAVNGTLPRNAVRGAAKVIGAGHGLGGGLMAIEAARSAHDAGLDLPQALAVGALTGGAGWGLNRLGNAMTKKEASQVADLLRMRSPLAEKMKTQVYGVQPTAVGKLPYQPAPLIQQNQQALVSALQNWLAQRPAAANQDNN